uniref:Uncharacterized protein n=1 Tax=Junco hyemalis TaxID=40217 RepID=A0A8C5NNH6_JUNHY
RFKGSVLQCRVLHTDLPWRPAKIKGEQTFAPLESRIHPRARKAGGVPGLRCPGNALPAASPAGPCHVPSGPGLRAGGTARAQGLRRARGCLGPAAARSPPACAGPGRAGRPPPHGRQHYRVQVEHGAHEDEQESDGEDGEVQHGQAGAAERRRLGPTPGPPAGQEGADRTGQGAGLGSARLGMGSPRRLLLISNSTLHGGGYLGHCQQHIQSFLGQNVRRVLFIPYALHDRDAYARTAREKFESLGYGLDSIHESCDPVEAVRKSEAIFIGGGNTFRLLKALYDNCLIHEIRKRVLEVKLQILAKSEWLDLMHELLFRQVQADSAFLSLIHFRCRVISNNLVN